MNCLAKFVKFWLSWSIEEVSLSKADSSALGVVSLVGFGTLFFGLFFLAFLAFFGVLFAFLAFFEEETLRFDWLL